MLTETQLARLFILTKNYYERNKKDAFLIGMSQLTTIKIYQPASIVFQNKFFQELENEFNSMHIDY